jgi:hypothetical protein
MTIRNTCLGTAASLVLALALSPAIAGPNGPQESTPAEKEQTRQLNSAQINGSYVDPAVANGQQTAAQPVPAEAVAAAASNSKNDDATVQAQQDAALASQQQYQADLARADADRAAYELEMAAYARRHPSSWWRYRYENASLDAFYTLSRPALVDVAVTDRNGYLVGRIREVVSAPDGRISRVKIDLGHSRTAWIEARDLRYFATDRIIMIDLTPRQIWDRSTPL